MVGVAAGLATMGYVLCFQLCHVCSRPRLRAGAQLCGYPHLNVKIGATHGGISVARTALPTSAARTLP